MGSMDRMGCKKGDNEAAVDEQVQLNAVVSAIMEWIGPLTTNQ
ncbi:hypothetical protein ACFP56_14555 [Paenibacillus septentrionalis]|uniref:Uncharacterized protein n=1 Tax=Paenibacillus septentrionalis TaxID=429342 RepID=A0ABW1V8T4_9BACL